MAETDITSRPSSTWTVHTISEIVVHIYPMLASAGRAESYTTPVTHTAYMRNYLPRTAFLASRLCRTKQVEAEIPTGHRPLPV